MSCLDHVALLLHTIAMPCQHCLPEDLLNNVDPYDR